MSVFLSGQRLRFPYINHRNVSELRDVRFEGLNYGDNEWYPERQWFMCCYDFARGGYRSFALSRIDADKIEIVPAVIIDRGTRPL